MSINRTHTLTFHLKPTEISQMNYPINLSTSITSGDIATPKVYLKFEDKSDFGKNDGTYGDFTDETDSVNGPDVGPY